MDTPSTLEEMRLQDPALATEYLNMMIELRGLIYTLSASEAQSVGYAAIQLPVPSEKLKQFKDKFKRVLVGDDKMNELEKQYREYKFFADTRGMKMLADRSLVDEYNTFMSKCEEILFSDNKIDTFVARIELPKPSSALEAFKNRFNKFF